MTTFTVATFTIFWWEYFYTLTWGTFWMQDFYWNRVFLHSGTSTFTQVQDLSTSTLLKYKIWVLKLLLKYNICVLLLYSSTRSEYIYFYYNICVLLLLLKYKFWVHLLLLQDLSTSSTSDSRKWMNTQLCVVPTVTARWR